MKRNGETLGVPQGCRLPCPPCEPGGEGAKQRLVWTLKVADDMSSESDVGKLKTENRELREEVNKLQVRNLSLESVIKKYRRKLIRSFEEEELGKDPWPMMPEDIQVEHVGVPRVPGRVSVMGRRQAPMFEQARMDLARDRSGFETCSESSKESFSSLSEASKRKECTKAPSGGGQERRKAGKPLVWNAKDEEVFMSEHRAKGNQWRLYNIPGKTRAQIQSHGAYLIKQGKIMPSSDRCPGAERPYERPGSSVDECETGTDRQSN